ncbi:MAG: class I SAM-dependent methyltransferase, partial [Flavobacteriales bacterium]|nr:class I SAM-dependent methyltransferase [Flavobacteriales bacterium]
KTSPFLDIKQTLSDLKSVSKVWIVSVQNDCKEVLYLVNKTADNNPEIIAVNIAKNTSTFVFDYEKESTVFVDFSEPQTYLYEPNASILKAGGFKSIAAQFGLNKLAVNTHLYTSNELITNFPGRVFKITNTLDYNEKSVKTLGLKKANIATRFS